MFNHKGDYFYLHRATCPFCHKQEVYQSGDLRYCPNCDEYWEE
jgi:hypothetical protein